MHEIPLVVLSFDRYADLWRPFFHFFWQQWPDCPFLVHLGTNYKTYSDLRVISINTGDEISWATRVQRIVNHLKSPYILMFLDDFLLRRTVNTAEILRLAKVATDNNVGCLRLAPNPPPSRRVRNHPELGWILPGDPYRVSSQVSFWRSQTLASLLQPDFSIWDFEFKGSLLSSDLPDPFWSVWKPVIDYRDCLGRGRWFPWGLAACRAAGIDVDLKNRPEKTKQEMRQVRWSAFRGRVFKSLPRSIQRKRWSRIVERYLVS